MTSLVQRYYDPAGTVGQNGVDFNTEAGVRTFLAARTPVASDETIEIFITGVLNLTQGFSLGGAADDTRLAKFKPKLGNNVNVLQTAPLDQGSSGAAIQIDRTQSYPATSDAGIYYEDLRVLLIGSTGTNGEHNSLYCQNTMAGLTWDTKFTRCRFYDTSIATGTSAVYFGAAGNRGLVEDCVGVVDSAPNKALFGAGDKLNIVRGSFAAIGAAAGNARLLKDNYAAQSVFNCVAINFGQLYSTVVPSAQASNNFVNVAPTAGATYGYAVVAGAGALVLNEASDLTLKAGCAAVGGASAAAAGTLDILSNNRGPTPDAGAKQLTAATPLPSGTVTSQPVTNTNTVTVNFTTTGSPTASGSTADLVAVNTPYNNAVSKSGTLTLGSGTGSAVFTGLKNGLYAPSIKLHNGGGDAYAADSLGNITIADATGTLASEVLDGQTYTVSVSYTGPVSAINLLVPAAATNPNGAYSAGPVALTLDTVNKTATGSVTLVGGNYDPGVITLVSTNGTSMPLAGTTAKTVVAATGNPEAPPVSGDTTAPTLVSAAVANGAPTTVVLTTSETLDSAYVPATSAFTVTGHTVTAVAVTGNAINLTVTPAFVYGEAARSVTYTKPATNAVRDPAGNQMSSFGTQGVTNNAVATDTTPPTVTAAAVANATPTTVVLTTSEPLNTAFVPAASAFTVGGHAVTAVAVSGSSISLTVNPAFVYGEAARTVAYAQPATNGARDAAGNQMVGFTSLAVASSVAAPPAPITGVTISPATLTIAAGGTQQFTAVATGPNATQTFTWSRSPAQGTVSVNGLFTAPQVTQPTTIAVTATSTQDSNYSATAQVLVAPVAASLDFTRSKTRTIKVKAAPLTFEGSAFWKMTDPRKPTGSIDSDAVIDISFDWTEVLADISDTIKKVDFNLVGLTSAGGFSADGIATVFVSNPVMTNNKPPSITCHITTNSTPSRIEERTVFLTIEDQ